MQVSRYAQFFLFLIGLGMILVGGYLAGHYFEVHFPTSLVSGTLCDLSSFWNCDTAVFSPLAQIGSVPIALLGGALGVLVLLTSFFTLRGVHQVNYTVAIVNGIGCLLLLGYSVFWLHAICPGCLIYYVLSFLWLGFYWKFAGDLVPGWDLKVFVVYGLFFAAIWGVTDYRMKSAMDAQRGSLEKIVSEFEHASRVNDTRLASPFKLYMSTKAFEDAPLRLTLMSDFQCPACKVFADILPKLIKQYDGRINVQYMFYPLDPVCNSSVSQPIHPQACEAAYLSVCKRDQFEQIHNEIYAHQSQLPQGWIYDAVERYGVSSCFQDPATHKEVESLISQAESAGITATPTLILNGRKIEGLLPLKFMIAIFDKALELKDAEPSQPLPPAH